MEGALNAMLDMTPGNLPGGGGAESARTGSDGQTMRQIISKRDPHFEERMRIMRRVMGEEAARRGALLEPEVRMELARAMVRRFSLAELKDINAFFATASGGRFAAEVFDLWNDPEVTRSMMQKMPDLRRERAEMWAKIEAATAHLPKPRPQEKKDRERNDRRD